MLTVYWLDSTHPMTTRNVSRFLGKEELHATEIGYHIVPPDRRFVAHRYVNILHYVISGAGTFNGQPFSAGDCYVTVSGEPEDVIPDPDNPYETVWIIFLGKLAPKVLADCGIEPRNHVFHFKNTDECIHLIKRALFEKKYRSEKEEAFDMQSLLYRLLSRHIVCNNNNKLSDREQAVVMAAEYIDQNFNRPLSIKNVAEYVHFSPNYLCSVFKEKFGVSPQEYLINYRIDRAKFLLKNYKELSISDVAESIGIKDQLYFSRIFKSRTGMTPREYKKTYK